MKTESIKPANHCFFHIIAQVTQQYSSGITLPTESEFSYFSQCKSHMNHKMNTKIQNRKTERTLPTCFDCPIQFLLVVVSHVFTSL